MVTKKSSKSIKKSTAKKSTAKKSTAKKSTAKKSTAKLKKERDIAAKEVDRLLTKLEAEIREFSSLNEHLESVTGKRFLSRTSKLELKRFLK